MADGGEGTLDAFERARADSVRMPVQVVGPTGEPVQTHWLLLPACEDQPETAVVELASAVGIELLPGGLLRPMTADSLGFGQVIAQALNEGVERLILAIGGSASSDGGAGMLAALGARITQPGGDPITAGAAGLDEVDSVDLSLLRSPPAGGVIVLTDVTSPLLGPEGAAKRFSPQKGATAHEVSEIETNLRVWGQLLSSAIGRDEIRTPGAGAAGGVGFALASWGAELRSGADTVAELTGLHSALENADLVITGEGRFDEQSLGGKAPGVVLNYAAQLGVPAAIVSGRIGLTPELSFTTVGLEDLAGGTQAAMAQPAAWLEEAGRVLAERFTRELGAP